MSNNPQKETLDFFAELIEKVLAKGGDFFNTLAGDQKNQLPAGAETLNKQIWQPAIESIIVSILEAATKTADMGVTRETLDEITTCRQDLGLETADSERILDLVLSVIFEEDLLNSPKTLDINGVYFKFERNGQELFVERLISQMTLLEIIEEILNGAERNSNPIQREELTTEARSLFIRCQQILKRRETAKRGGASPILAKNLRVIELRILTLEYSLVF